jgi:biopolymer transport protein ExbD
MSKKTIVIIVTVVLCVYLIRVFIFSTTMTQAEAMKLGLPKSMSLPADKTDSAAVNGVMTFLLLEHDSIYCYTGNKLVNGQYMSYAELGNALLKKKQSTDSAHFVVVIKPARSSNYKNFVNILDQMAISNIKRYVTVDLSDEEQEFAERKH